MKKIAVIYLLFFLFFVLACKTNSKPEAKEETVEESKEPYARPIDPQYAEGDKAMYAFINQNLKYPAEAKKNNISGSVIVSFTVLVSGELADIKVQQGIGYGCNEESVRIVKLMPKWKPANYPNNPIEMFYSIAIVFENKL